MLIVCGSGREEERKEQNLGRAAGALLTVRSPEICYDCSFPSSILLHYLATREGAFLIQEFAVVEADTKRK